MTISVQQFRADFPEFGSSTQFTSSQVQFWLNAAYSFLNTRRWGRQLDIGAELYAAHNVAIEARAAASAANGGVPGEQVGPVNSKSVDKVSMGYDTSAGTVEGAGDWNLTVYGTRFMRMARMFGAGGIQIGIGAVPSNSGQGWPGPLTTPGFSNF